MSRKLKFSTDNAELNITGSTYCIKDTLKELGAKWDPNTNSWNFPISLDTPAFRDNLNSVVVKAIEKIKVDNLKRTVHFRPTTDEDNVKRAIKIKESNLNGCFFYLTNNDNFPLYL